MRVCICKFMSWISFMIFFQFSLNFPTKYQCWHYFWVRKCMLTWKKDHTMKKIHDMNLQMHTLIIPQFSTSLNMYDCVVWHLIQLENLKHQSMLCCRMTKCQASWSNKNGTMFKHELLCIGSSICHNELKKINILHVFQFSHCQNL